MADYTLAWSIIGVMAFGGSLAMLMLLRPVKALWLKLALVSLVVAFLVLPAPVPAAPEVWAPAFVVAIFEAFFQIDGDPASATMVLSMGIPVVVVLAAIVGLLWRRKFPLAAETTTKESTEAAEPAV